MPEEARIGAEQVAHLWLHHRALVERITIQKWFQLQDAQGIHPESRPAVNQHQRQSGICL